jgi:hypothetical protein
MLTYGEGKGKELAASALSRYHLRSPAIAAFLKTSFKFGPVVAGKAYAHRDG